MRVIYALAILLVIILASCAEKQVSRVREVVKEEAVAEEAAPSSGEVACYSDSDCGPRRAENTYCFQGQVVGDLYTWTCENPGTVNARCVESHKSGLVSECKDNYFCMKGQCVKYADCVDTDGGMVFDKRGEVRTNDLSVYEDYCKKSDTLVEYYCSTDDRAFSETEYCKCERGACVAD